MRRMVEVTAGVVVSLFVVVAAGAAPGEPPGTGVQKQAKGGMKAMNAKREREAKVQETKKRAAALKQQAVSGK